VRITLNLATRPFADLGPAIKRLRIAMAVLVVLAIGLGFGLRALDQKAEQARARDHSLDGQIASITHERQGYQELMRQPPNAQLLAQSAVLNKHFNDKAFSWTLAMEDLETVLPGGVQVSTLEPVPNKDGHITLHLRVLGPRDRAIELVRNLEHSRRFLFPRITGENIVETNARPGEAPEPVSASNRVNFDILAEYNPALPGERKLVKKPAEKRFAELKARTEEASPASPQPGVIIQNHLPIRPAYTPSLVQPRVIPPSHFQPNSPSQNQPVPGRPAVPPTGGAE
jgi:type IV pilus assembly protein PilN